MAQMTINNLRKKIKSLELEIKDNEAMLERNKTIVYGKDENPIIAEDKEVTKCLYDIEKIYEELVPLKIALYKANAETVTQYAGWTLQKALISLPIMYNRQKVLKEMLDLPPIKRGLAGWGEASVEFTKINFDRKDIAEMYETQVKLVQSLQEAIDVASLTTIIEI